MKRTKTARVALAITLADGKAPTEFRLFTAGTVSTDKGDFVFDAKASKAVLAAWAEQGNELPIDYDHAMINPSTRPQDRVAAGWFTPEVRENGELWASNVRWTPDGEKAVASGGWRYTSPYFGYEVESKRVTKIVNVAITNLPATKHMDPLVAMSAEALATGEAEEAQPATTQPLAASSGTPGAQPKGPHMKSIFAALSLAETSTESDALVALNKLQSATSDLLALTGKSNAVEALGVVRGWQACSTEHATLSKRVAEMEAEASASKLEALIKLGKDDGKLVPAQEVWARTQSPAALEAFLSSAPRVVPLSPGAPGVPPAVAGKAWADLSTAELHRLANDNPEAFAALKAAATR